jgi:hypothetical protein
MTQLDPPAEISAFLDRLHERGEQVVRGSKIEWVRHPTKVGRWVGVVRVEKVGNDDRADTMQKE